jgi:hypothetical protein
MNNNIAAMMQMQLQEQGRMARLEQTLLVSMTVNTSTGSQISPYDPQSNNYIICSSQGNAIYSHPSMQSQVLSSMAAVPLARPIVSAAERALMAAYLQALRSDATLQLQSKQRCKEMDVSLLGNAQISTNKKSRGLMRAGGEASQHVYTEWPHDYVMVGPDQQRVYYRDLTLEQWAYGDPRKAGEYRDKAKHDCAPQRPFHGHHAIWVSARLRRSRQSANGHPKNC